MNYNDLLRGMIVSVKSKKESIKSGIYTVLQNGPFDICLKNNNNTINNVEELLDEEMIKISLINEKDIHELYKTLEVVRLNDAMKEILDAAIDNIIPIEVKMEKWTDTKCPSCNHILSKSYNDGYYSVEKVPRCPNCSKLLKWK